MGEQGAESIHSLLMKYERTYQGIPNELDRLEYIVREQVLSTAPSLLGLRPPVKKRKLDDSDESDDSPDNEDGED